MPSYPGQRMGWPSLGVLHQLWSQERPDVVHITTQGPLGWAALQVSCSLSIPVSTDFRTNFHSYSNHYGLGWLKQPILNYLRHFHNRSQRTMVPTEALRKELVNWVRKEIGPIASPDVIQFAPGLPKTRSGKIMRRILRKIAEDDLSNLGDTSTLAEPAVVDDLVKNRAARRGDDEIISDGQRVSTREIEAVLAGHGAVAEAAAVGFPSAKRGEAVWAFVTPEPGAMVSDVLAADLKGWVRRELGAQAVPEVVQFGPLPRTPSGEVVRPLLERIAATGEAGDVSGLADTAVADYLVKTRADAQG